MKTKSALSYAGSDSESAETISRQFNHYKIRHTSIPFFGGGGIVRLLKSRTIVANDKNALAMNFYRVLTGRHGDSDKESLIRCCNSTLSHPDEIFLAEKTLADPENQTVVQKAWAYWALCWIGRKGKGGTDKIGGPPSVRWSAGGGANGSRIRAAAGDLKEWANEFERCDWIEKPFEEAYEKFKDHDDNGIYSDSPWVKKGFSYLHDFGIPDHKTLAEYNSRFDKSLVVVRYGDDSLIRDLYQEPKWKWKEVETKNQVGNAVKEVLISNRKWVD
jgi:hypothetical protein